MIAWQCVSRKTLPEYVIQNQTNLGLVWVCVFQVLGSTQCGEPTKRPIFVGRKSLSDLHRNETRQVNLKGHKQTLIS